MNRRQFLGAAGYSGAGLFFVRAPLLRAAQTDPRRLSARELYRALVNQNDGDVKRLLVRQNQAASDRWFGGMTDAYGIHAAGPTSGFVRSLACAYVAPESVYHRSAILAERIRLAAGYLCKAQHDDGTIDLHTTNFHSPPDTGFVLEWVCGAYGILRKTRPPELELEPALSDLRAFILKAADALSVGGIHTPNHRWVVCMALARANAMFPNSRYVQRIEEWLAERIDIDADGQFTEKSTAIYSPLTDRCLITVARLLDKPELYDPVRQNLRMTLYYVHPDGEIVTEASRRQDQYARGSMAPYHYPYRFMARLDQDGQFAAMARRVVEVGQSRLTANLLYFLEDDDLLGELPPSRKLPTSYNRWFRNSSLARIRRDGFSATILANNPTLLSMRKGRAALESLRFASAFFGKGQFQGEALLHSNGRYEMRQSLVGPYYQPFPKAALPTDGDWHKMPRDLRPKSEVQRLESHLAVWEQNGGLGVNIRIEGTAGVPVAIELAFRRGGQLEQVEASPEAEGVFFLPRGYGRYVFDGHQIEFGPGRKEHRWTQLRGALPRPNALCVYLTGFTPCEWSLDVA